MGASPSGAGLKNQAPTEFFTRARVVRVFGCQNRLQTKPRSLDPQGPIREWTNFLLAYLAPLDHIVLLPALERPAEFKNPQLSLLCWKGALVLEGSLRCILYLTPGEPSLGDTKNIAIQET
jgi:hypothetical protein